MKKRKLVDIEEEVVASLCSLDVSEITDFICKAAKLVFSNLGRGHSETVYRDALICQLQMQNGVSILCDREVVCPVFYNGRSVGSKRMDLIVTYLCKCAQCTANCKNYKKVIVELKALACGLAVLQTNQALAYLRCCGTADAVLLMNFDQRDKQLQSMLEEKNLEQISDNGKKIAVFDSCEWNDGAAPCAVQTFCFTKK